MILSLSAGRQRTSTSFRQMPSIGRRDDSAARDGRGDACTSSRARVDVSSSYSSVHAGEIFYYRCCCIAFSFCQKPSIGGRCCRRAIACAPISLVRARWYRLPRWDGSAASSAYGSNLLLPAVTTTTGVLLHSSFCLFFDYYTVFVKHARTHRHFSHPFRRVHLH